jgi:hypothetical protein
MTRPLTDSNKFSVPVVWSRLYAELKSTPWEDTDLDNALYNLGLNHEKISATLALKYVYDQAQSWTLADPEDAVLAVLKACSEHHQTLFLTPGQVKEMARNFAVFYPEPDDVLEQHLLEYYNGIPLEWLTEAAREEVEKAAHSPSEIWVGEDEKLAGLWVFNKPSN